MQLAFEFGEGRTQIEPGPDDLERWRPIEGWPGYDVSDWGRVRSFKFRCGKGGWRIGSIPRIIGGYADPSHRYEWVMLLGEGGRQRKVGIHILVLEAFIGSRPPDMEACHNDGNRLNNRANNLRWDTHGNNQRDSIRHGTHNLPVLTEVMIPDIWRRLVMRESCVSIAKDYGVHRGTIEAIRRGQTWTHITRSLPGRPYRRPYRRGSIAP